MNMCVDVSSQLWSTSSTNTVLVPLSTLLIGDTRMITGDERNERNKGSGLHVISKRL